MTGPPGIPPGVATPGEDAQPSETASEPLPWQGELDVAIADIDSKLSHSRRRSIDESTWHVPEPTVTAPPEPRALPRDIAVTIRIRKPLLRFWPLRRRRRRRQALITLSVYRAT